LDEATSSNTHIPAYISRRRQKQLLAHYGDFALPPSPLNAAALAAELRWEDGSVVSWAGDAEAKDTNSLYGGRKRMFKGHKHEREKPDKMRDTAERMKGMGKRVEDWKKVGGGVPVASCLLVLTNSDESGGERECEATVTLLAAQSVHLACTYPTRPVSFPP
jgi:hypothetical protein